MNEYALFALLGLGSGAVIAALALGIVQIYRGSGVINIAQGAVAMYVAYVYYELRDSGYYLLPIPGLPARTYVGKIGTAGALSLALVTAVVLGLLIHLLIFRPLRNAPPLAKVVASVGLTLTLQAIIVLRFGTNALTVPAVLPDDTHSVKLFGSLLPLNRLYLGVLVIAAAAALWALFTHTQFGRATRAAAENEKGAALLGFSPDLLAAVSWIIGSLIAGIGGIVVSPLINLNPATFPLLVVPALAAALLGRFASFGVTAAGALLLGVAQSIILKLASDFSWFPQVGAQQLLPFLVIIVVTFMLGSYLPSRGTLLTTDLPFAPRTRNVTRTTIVAVLAAIALLSLTTGSARLAVINSLVGAILCLSLVVITGFVGQISLAQVTFAGIAGFTLATFTTTLSIPFPLAPLLSVAVATAFAVLIAIPALRVRGINLAVVTLAAAVAVEEFYFKNPDYTGGLTGSVIPSPKIFGLDLGITKGTQFPRIEFGLLVLGVLTVLSLLVANLRRSALGRNMLAVRANERAAAASGINVATTKIVAFALSGFIAGTAGVLIGYQRSTLSADSFGVFTCLTTLAIAYLGGISSVSGAMLGGILTTGGVGFYLLDRAFGIGSYETLLAGLGLIITAVINPEGISGALRRIPIPWPSRHIRQTAAEPSDSAGHGHHTTEEAVAGGRN